MSGSAETFMRTLDQSSYHAHRKSLQENIHTQLKLALGTDEIGLCDEVTCRLGALQTGITPAPRGIKDSSRMRKIPPLLCPEISSLFRRPKRLDVSGMNRF